MTREALRAVIDERVARLVARAAVKGWPIRADHCFLRIAYDNAVGAKWDTVVKPPAWRNLPLDRMAAALAVLIEIERSDGVALDADNAASLAWRRQAASDKMSG